MANAYFNPTGVPQASSQAISAPLRAEFAAIESGFNKFGTFTPNGIYMTDSTGQNLEFSSTLQFRTVHANDATFGWSNNGSMSISYTTRRYSFVQVGRIILGSFRIEFTMTLGTATGSLYVVFPQLEAIRPLSTNGISYGHFSNCPYSTSNYILGDFAGAFVGGIGFTSAMSLKIMDPTNTTPFIGLSTNDPWPVGATSYTFVGSLFAVLNLS